MKHITTIVILILFSRIAQSQNTSNSFESLWNQVEKHEKKTLTKSALAIVSEISDKAKKEKNGVQTIKALLYKSKYSLLLKEDAQLLIINDFKAEIEKSNFPIKNILQSYLANMYWQYFQQNRYKFYQRTKIATKEDTTDFRTWDLPNLHQEIRLFFEASLANEEGLKEVPISKYNILLNKQDGSEDYRPSLFDLLAHNALDFYKTDENNIIRPADFFEINDPELLSDGETFIKKNIPTEDKLSLHVKALQLYQKLLRYHSNSKKSYAYASVDIERLLFVYQNASFKNKDQQLLKVLHELAQTSKDNLASSLYNYELASLLAQLGKTYKAKNQEKHRWKLKEAIDLCEMVIAAYPSSAGAEKCKQLKKQLQAQRLSLVGESFIPVNKTSRLLVTYKNYNFLELSAYKLTPKQFKMLSDLYSEEKKLAFIKNLDRIKKWEVTLKNEHDFQEHSTEVLIPPLANGYYLILAQPKDNSKNVFSYNPVQVTDMALVTFQGNTKKDFQLIHRNTGKPISGATINFSYRLNYNDAPQTKNLVTNQKGMVSIPLSKDTWSDIKIIANYNNEKAFFNGYYLNRWRQNETKKDSYSCFLFTDRSIYRPGQPLYFKGIAIKKGKNKSSIITNTKVTVQIFDVNGQIINKQELITNDYGSFSGEYILPNNGVLGSFSMNVSSKTANIFGYTNFSVEEYKRSKFETYFDPIKESYMVNDSIRVKGKAVAFAGSTIAYAKVSYRVKRLIQFPQWYYRHSPYQQSHPQEIAHGKTTTDGDGNYNINFKALPDLTIAKKNLPTFKYEISAAVTDINGETQTTKTIVSVGYHALDAHLEIAKLLDKNIDHKLTITTKNLNGEFVASKGTIKVYKLKAPSRVLRPRTWPAPDYVGFSKEKFKQLYPYDPYNNEHDSVSWKKEALVWQTNFDTKKSKEINLEIAKNWRSGTYVIELETKDKFGQLVKDEIQTSLFSFKDRKIADNQLFQIKTDKKNYVAGDIAKVTLLSSAKDLTITVHVEKNHTVVATHLVHLNNNSKTFTVPIKSDDLGGFAITYSFAFQNYFKAGNIVVKVPYPSTDLEIETLTFRDKLKPGSEETWSFKIKGPKGDKVSAELLAGMYDASLDALRNHNWTFKPWNTPNYYSRMIANAKSCFKTNMFSTFNNYTAYSTSSQNFDTLHWFGFQFGQPPYTKQTKWKMMSASHENAEMQMMGKTQEQVSFDPQDNMASEVNLNRNEVTESGGEELEKNSPQNKYKPIKIRKNLQETAFFFPQLRTNKEGTISFSFSTPEALSQWKLQLLAHTKTLETTYQTLQTVTKKELMVVPNMPRFLREGDRITLSSKIVNLSDKKLSGIAKLVLTDALTGENITHKILVETDNQHSKNGELTFSVASSGNTQVSWQLSIPKGIQAVQHKVIARAGAFSDGEQNLLPVLSNKMLVTETLPMWVKGGETKTFTLNKLKTSSSSSLKHHKLSLEITSNPAWYALQALPYLMEYPYDCNEQTFSKYYANTLASFVANSNTKLQEVFKVWSNSDALLSNLEKNQELKSLLIQETPWLRDAQSETEQKKRIGLLFNLNKMKSEQIIALSKLKQNQKSSGAWPWFNGGPDNRFITQYIVTGLGHLIKIGAISNNIDTEKILRKAIAYLDQEFIAAYTRMKKNTKNIDIDLLSESQLYYLYMRSFFKHIKTSKKVDEVSAYYKKQAEKFWPNKSLYAKGLIALIMHRTGDYKTASLLLRSLKENSISSNELGMYWKENTNSWYWHQAPIETQSLLIEAFSEIDSADVKTVNSLKIWLLKNKQTNQWKTTKATSEAVYALLLKGSDWLSVADAVEVSVAGHKIEDAKLENVKVEARTGYYKTTWNAAEINPKLAEIKLNKKEAGISWGALYWQYFEDLDKISNAETPLKLKKNLFLKKNTATGEEISKITNNTIIKIGDLVKVRIELRVDRPMEFVHMKDMRAAGFEPVNVISSYKWQDGLGYYESTKDASTNFFFDYLPKGVFIFEYDLRVNNKGDFSNGITSIKSMYAPEFSSHSKGVRISIQ